MRNILIVAGGAVAVAAIAAAVWFGTRPPSAGPPPVAVASADKSALLNVQPGDHVLGDPKAPITLIEYASFTCPHCAHFHTKILPELKKKWIDSGRVRFVYRHYPSDSVATHASQLAECAGPDRFYAAIGALFSTQVDWLTASDPDSELVKAAEKAGIAGAGQCLANDRLLDKIVADVQSGQALKVRATPTLFINEQFYGNPADGAQGISAILSQVAR